MADPEQATPEETLAAFRRAMTSREWHRALSFLSPKAQKKLAGSAYAEAAWMEGHDEVSRQGLAALMKRYGLLDEGVVDKRSTDELARMLADLDAWSSESFPPDRRLDLAAYPAETTWSEFRLSGDRAYAVATLRGRRSETRLRCHEGSWYILANGE